MVAGLDPDQALAAPTSRCWDDGTVEVTLKFATIIAVVIALAIGFDAGHFIWP